MRTSKLLSVFALALVAGFAFGQTPATVPPGTTIKVELEKKVDSKKSKVGDPVVAKVQQEIKIHDAVLIPKNSLLTGTVTEVDPSENHGPGKIGVLFNQVTDKKGRVLAHLRAAITQIEGEYGNEYGMLSRPAEMGGNGAPPPMQGGNGGTGNLASNGVPVAFSIMEAYNGSGTDLGGVMVASQSNFNLDEGTKVQVRVLQ